MPTVAKHNAQDRISFLMGGLFLLYFICLIYKVAAAASLVMVAFAALSFLLPTPLPAFVLSPIFIFTVLYSYEFTGTAIIADFSEGIYRNVQFTFLLMGALAFAKWRSAMNNQTADKILKYAAILSAAIFVHMILYHIYIGRLSPWKYLLDTKSIISVIVVLFFAFQDHIKGRIGLPGWFVALAVVGVLIVLSGERKAYMLFAICYLLCRDPLLIKVLIVLLIGLSLSFYLYASDENGYISRQILSIFEESRPLTVSEFYMIQDVGDQSNIIRDFVNRNARELFHENPIFGLGATGYQKWANANLGAQFGDPKGINMNVHGEINRVPAEGGLVGIVIGLGYVALVARAVFSHLKIPRFRNSSLSRAYAYLFVFLLCYCSFEASDTFMISLLLFFGVEVAHVHRRDLYSSLRTLNNKSWRRHRYRPRTNPAEPSEQVTEQI
ncbi:UNVERIFIED_ORG: hypothetical protein M2435_006592 [Rhizobium sophorae]|uniref:O-antigen ligase family protein n=1 Tax=Rhizobium leguminosarum TaxID=384 RepID=UPI000DE4BCD1|nr:O-antigen ligase family protein [Rhizobium leguminosarum]MBB4526521.1 hypothetical protein [Rhizobium leguminosarum]MDH6663646.1 hypothetical protein [Rhizobium sophorae]